MYMAKLFSLLVLGIGICRFGSFSGTSTSNCMVSALVGPELALLVLSPAVLSLLLLVGHELDELFDQVQLVFL